MKAVNINTVDRKINPNEFSLFDVFSAKTVLLRKIEPNFLFHRKVLIYISRFLIVFSVGGT